MGIIALIVWSILIGAVIGALGRLIVPGRNPIGIGMTILFGIIGAIGGGLIGRAAHLGSIVTFIIEVLIAAALVYLVSGRSRSRSRVM